MRQVTIPRARHQKMLTWKSSPRPKFRLKIQTWCEENIGIHGIDWHIKMIRNNQATDSIKRAAPDYVLVASRVSVVRFMLTWL